MKQDRCPITYRPIRKGEHYSAEGLRKLSPLLKTLHPLPWSAEEQRLEARKRAHKISIQGVQPKLSAKLNATEGQFEIVDIGGKYILKPPSEVYPELPENEDLSMRLAATVDIEVPLHGLLYSKDDSMTYFIRRFDRGPYQEKIAVEDFAQLSEKNRSTKYDSSMEQVTAVIDRYCTFPLVEKRKLFVRTLFNFLIGNEDMHLKNFSLITTNDKVGLAPAYDFLNSTIALINAEEELALPLSGKKRNLKKSDFFDYFAVKRLGLNQGVIDDIRQLFTKNISQWQDITEISFLSPRMKESFWKIVRERRRTLDL